MPDATSPPSAPTTPRRRGRPPGPNPTPRGHLALEAGPLRPAVEAAAKAAGLTLSAWLKRAITRELDAAGHEPVSTTWPGTPGRPTGSPAKTLGPVVRLQLDAATAARLEAYRSRGNFRSRPAALRFALYAAEQPQAIDVAPLAAAVTALIRSNYELGPIGNNLNQIARALNTAMGRVGQQELDHLNVFLPEAQRHVATAARVAGLLNAFLKPHKAPRGD